MYTGFKFCCSLQDVRLNDQLRRKISHYASSGAKMCWIIHMISGSYVEVSHKYLLHRIAGILNCYRSTGRERLIRIRLIRSYYEIFFYHFSNISCLKCTVNLNFHLIRSKTLPTNDFELTVPNL